MNASGSSVYEEPVLKVNMTIKEEPGVKYMIIGAGGTGGTLGFYLTKAGKDVTLIARGSHLEAMQKQGLTMKQLWETKKRFRSKHARWKNTQSSQM